ncbi:cyclic-phosphate processing receiver domain-containing protein [Amycolatopsis mediterranei]|uniref:cyclic-phosphate processing receiver domain-containing protein n=1 Tax=Amycolatopsis mediterranei TaxID=33910 RepID=UPI003447831D
MTCARPRTLELTRPRGRPPFSTLPASTDNSAPPGVRRRGDDTTRPVVLWLCEHDRRPAEVRVHTANPVGREWLTGMARRYGPGVR